MDINILVDDAFPFIILLVVFLLVLFTYYSNGPGVCCPRRYGGRNRRRKSSEEFNFDIDDNSGKYVGVFRNGWVKDVNSREMRSDGRV